ncbi:MAG TPA: adenylate cyclase regulatory domain-containing protein [Acidimicrobiales bacterium]|nr:adenylate cyclase regulatory domain-containing protein [Acidimicrobiales bacterium]
MKEARAFLQAHGISDADIDKAVAAGTVHLLVIEHLASPGEAKYTERDIAELSGITPEDLHRFWRALGFPDVEPDDRLFTDRDLDALVSVAGAISMGVTSLDVAIQLTRVIGSSMARIAEAEVQSSAHREPGESERMAELYALTGGGPLGGLANNFELVWRRHLQAALRRHTMEHGEGENNLAVGFCDLVGFTAMSQQLSDEELAHVVTLFEELAYDTVAAGGGRVVKMIGDEVMYVVENPAIAAHIGLALADAYSDEETLSDVRVGVAYGSVLGREGDYFGPVVNLAHRIVNIAYPGTVVVSTEVADAIREDADLELLALRPRLLKDIGRVPLFAVSRPGEARVSWRGRSRRPAPARALAKAVLAEAARRQVERHEAEREGAAGAADASGGHSPD